MVKDDHDSGRMIRRAGFMHNIRKSNGDHSLFHQLLSAGNRDLDCPVKYIEDFDLAVHMCLIIVVIGYFYKQIAIPVLIDHPVIPSCRFSKSAFF